MHSVQKPLDKAEFTRLVDEQSGYELVGEQREWKDMP